MFSGVASDALIEKADDEISTEGWQWVAAADLEKLDAEAREEEPDPDEVEIARYEDPDPEEE